MGFFDFFKKSEEKESGLVETLNLNEVEPFLDKKTEELSKKITQQTTWIKQEVNEEIEKLKHNLQVLENAEVRNKEIPERALHIMQGNREIYLQKTSTLIEKIIFPEKPQELLSFIENFDKELGIFDKSVAKSHQIMEEFFVEKASIIATNIKKIDKLFKELKRTLEDSGLPNVGNLKRQSFSLIEKVNQKEENKNNFNQTDKEIKKEEQELKKKESSIKNIQQGESYLNALSLINSKEELKKEIEELNSQMKHSFSEIEPALKKYENLSQNKLVKKYLESPLDALLEDEDLEIAVIAYAIKNAIIAKEITLKDKKKDKIISELSKLNKEFFEEFLNKRIELTRVISEKATEIENSKILKDLAELEKSFHRDKAALQEKVSSFERMKKDLEATNISDLTSSLEVEIKDKLGLDVKII